MSETWLNAKCDIEGFNSFQCFLGHDLKYWGPFTLQVALMKTEIQKFEYRENEKSFLDEIKSFFHNYYIRAAIWWKNDK